MTNHFQTLGVSLDANESQVKKAYRTLAKQWHPDKNGSITAESKFKEINAAYEYLKSEDRRGIHAAEIRRATTTQTARTNGQTSTTASGTGAKPTSGSTAGGTSTNGRKTPFWASAGSYDWRTPDDANASWRKQSGTSGGGYGGGGYGAAGSSTDDAKKESYWWDSFKKASAAAGAAGSGGGSPKKPEPPKKSRPDSASSKRNRPKSARTPKAPHRQPHPPGNPNHKSSWASYTDDFFDELFSFSFDISDLLNDPLDSFFRKTDAGQRSNNSRVGSSSQTTGVGSKKKPARTDPFGNPLPKNVEDDIYDWGGGRKSATSQWDSDEDDYESFEHRCHYCDKQMSIELLRTHEPKCARLGGTKKFGDAEESSEGRGAGRREGYDDFLKNLRQEKIPKATTTPASGRIIRCQWCGTTMIQTAVVNHVKECRENYEKSTNYGKRPAWNNHFSNEDMEQPSQSSPTRKPKHTIDINDYPHPPKFSSHVHAP